jgi:hypothetical protein
MRATTVAAALVLALGASPRLPAQAPSAATPANAQAQQPFDLTGDWVAIVTQNWRYRMVVPGHGEYANIPINDAAKAFADAWSRARDTAAGLQCEAYGAAAIMRVPTHLRISWRDPETLQVQTDAGMQTRLLNFKAAPEAAAQAASWQGYSLAKWNLFTTRTLPFVAPLVVKGRYGQMEVATDHMLAGLLRKNGVPYSEHASMTEYWEVNVEPDGTRWLTVTTELRDPQYLLSPYVFNSIFRQEPDGSQWDPGPCTLDD